MNDTTIELLKKLTRSEPDDCWADDMCTHLQVVADLHQVDQDHAGLALLRQYRIVTGRLSSTGRHHVYVPVSAETERLRRAVLKLTTKIESYEDGADEASNLIVCMGDMLPECIDEVAAYRANPCEETFNALAYKMQ